MNSVGTLLAQVESVLDAAALARLRELDPDHRAGVVERVLKAYQNSLNNTLRQLDAPDPDVEMLRRLAHTLKSSSASVGALQLSQLCAQVEALAREHKVGELDAAVAQLRREGARVRDALAPLLAD